MALQLQSDPDLTVARFSSSQRFPLPLLAAVGAEGHMDTFSRWQKSAWKPVLTSKSDTIWSGS